MSFEAGKRGQKNQVRPTHELVAAIIRSAYKDLWHDAELTRERARWFFTSGVYRYWCELIDVNTDVAYAAYERIIAEGEPIDTASGVCEDESR